jgi:hypothetical protein
VLYVVLYAQILKGTPPTTCMRQVPLFGLLIAALAVVAAFYVSSRLENPILKFIIPFIALLFVVSAFMGLFYEQRIAQKIIQELKQDGYTINPRVEKILWEEIKKKTGYIPYQTSV